MYKKLFGLCVLIALCVFPPVYAYAADGDYTIEELSTSITVQTNAQTKIVEHHVLHFEENNLGEVMYLHKPEDGESLKLDTVRVAPVDDGGAFLDGWTRLQMIDSNPDRQGRKPGDIADPTLCTTTTLPWYSYRLEDGMLRCYFPLTDAEKTKNYALEVEYSISHRVRVYRDVAELYWRYANDSLPADANNINLQVVLPMPEGQDLQALHSEVKAWGHGPSDGRFLVGDNGVVTYQIDHIEAGNYAEAHIIFPASWETAVPANGLNQFSELHRTEAEAQEAQWVDIGQREAAWDNKVRTLFLIISGILIVLSVLLVARQGLNSRSRVILQRTAVAFTIVALGENLFFCEPVTTILLFGLALIFLILSLWIPTTDEITEQDEPSEETPGE